jgi:hypothetical protein
MSMSRPRSLDSETLLPRFDTGRPVFASFCGADRFGATSGALLTARSGCELCWQVVASALAPLGQWHSLCAEHPEEHCFGDVTQLRADCVIAANEAGRRSCARSGSPPDPRVARSQAACSSAGAACLPARARMRAVIACRSSARRGSCE